MAIKPTTRSLASVAMLVVVWAAAGPIFASAAPWQLTFAYNHQQLSLLRAVRLVPMAKTPKTPGLEGAVLKLDYAIEWLDADGQPILATTVTVPLGQRVVMPLDESAPSDSVCLLSEGAFVLRLEGPDDREQVAQVRLIKLGLGHGLAFARADLPQAFNPPEQTFPLPDPSVRLAAAGPVSATQVRHTGPDTNRLVIVFMGDGFTAANLAAGTFANKVSSFLAKLLATSPWDLYASLVNAYRVDIVSDQAGADYEDASPSAGGTLKDTYLNAAFWVGGTERCLSLTGDGTQKAYAAADDLVGAGVWDEILVFVNSQKYGGCGGAVGTSSLNASSDDVQIHEFGHSFASLADEYDYGSSSTNCNPTLARNVDCATRFPSVKWDPWVAPGTPIPTPDTSAYNHVVGAFEGAAYQATGMFRPMRNCRMRSLSAPFCVVCKEAHILKLFERVRLLDAATPAFGLADVPAYGARVFSVTPVQVAHLTYQWFLGGVPLPEATNAQLTVTGSQFAGTNVELRVDVTHVTTNVRAQLIVQSNFWRLRPADIPALAIADARAAEGHEGATPLQFTVTLSFPHDRPVSVRYTTVDGSARAGQDYEAQAGTLTFAPGQTTNQFIVLAHGDRQAESHEVFFVNLFDAVGAVVADRQGCGTILDDDSPPVITLTRPAPGDVFLAPVNVSLAAAPADYDGRITNVQFTANGSPLGEVIFRPFTLTWSNPPPGAHWLGATAWDNAGLTATAAPVRVTVLATSTQQWSLVTLADRWRYDSSTNEWGAAWKEPDFNDAGWLGPALPLFYNETARLPAPTNTWLPLTNAGGARLRSYYFRTRFDWPGSDLPGLVLLASNLVDDGAVFWLNGVELARLRMPAGPLTRRTLATGTPPNNSDATVFEVLHFSAGALRPGTNVLAAQVHQVDDSSSDVVFGMSLSAVQGLAPVFLDTQELVSGGVLQGRPLTLSVTATGLVPLAYQWFQDGVPLPGATNRTYSVASMSASHAGAYFVRATNVVGAVDSPVAQIHYLPDLKPPTVLAALGSNDSTRILVSFAEPVHPASATLLANYQVQPVEGGPPLVIHQATILHATNVLLVTSPREPGTNYALTVRQVRDLFDNVMPAETRVPIATELVLLAGDNQRWRYFQSDAAPAQGWMAPGFDDEAGGWAEGVALFDAKRPPRGAITNQPVRTQLNLTNPPAAPGQTLTYYFRSRFFLPGWPVGTRLWLRPLVDDGAVFYLNGEEVLRLRLPAAPAPVTYTNLAITSVDAGFYEGPFALPTRALRAGTNVLAVEVHQAEPTSSDISFAAQLLAEMPALGFVAPPLAASRMAGHLTLHWTWPEAILEEAPTVLGPWTQVQPPPASPFPVAPADAARFFRLRMPEP